MITPPRVPFTGEGFRGERILTITAVIMTIVSSALLIHLSTLQREHTRLQMDELKKKNGTT